MVEKECEYCNKKFKGVNSKQVDTQLVIHKITQHPDKVKVEKVKK